MGDGKIAPDREHSSTERERDEHIKGRIWGQSSDRTFGGDLSLWDWTLLNERENCILLVPLPEEGLHMQIKAIPKRTGFASDFDSLSCLSSLTFLGAPSLKCTPHPPPGWCRTQRDVSWRALLVGRTVGKWNCLVIKPLGLGEWEGSVTVSALPHDCLTQRTTWN